MLFNEGFMIDVVWMQLNRICLKHQAASEQLLFHLQWILKVHGDGRIMKER